MKSRAENLCEIRGSAEGETMKGAGFWGEISFARLHLPKVSPSLKGDFNLTLSGPFEAFPRVGYRSNRLHISRFTIQGIRGK